MKKIKKTFNGNCHFFYNCNGKKIVNFELWQITPGTIFHLAECNKIETPWADLTVMGNVNTNELFIWMLLFRSIFTFDCGKMSVFLLVEPTYHNNRVTDHCRMSCWIFPYWL